MANLLTTILYASIIFFSPICGRRIFKVKKKENKILLLVLFVFALSLIAAFRGKAGTDSEMYKMAYEHGANSVFRWVNFEIGYQWLMNFCHLLNLPYQFLFFMSNFFTLLFAFLAIDKEKSEINTSLATFILIICLYFFSFNALRQALAIGLCLYAIVSFENGQKIKAIIIIVIASLFHYSALICFSVVVAKTIFENRKNKITIALCLIALLLLVSNRQLFGYLIKFITRSDYYAGYVTRQADTDSSVINYFIKYFFVFLLSFLGFKNYKKVPRYYTYFALMLIGYIIASIGSVTQTQISRLGEYFIDLQIFVLGFCGKDKLKINHMYLSTKNTRMIIYFYFAILFIYNYMIQGFSQLFPYGAFELIK